ncbi:MAG TPA: single-stranded DNA-binding protein [Enteractinococcus sp.]
MSKVTILSADVEERGGTFKDDSGNDRAYSTRKQKAKLEVGGFAYPLDVRLEDGQKPWPVGEYTMDWDSMVSVNKGSINLSKYARLIPLAAATKAA